MTKHAHHLIYGAIQDGGVADCHCIGCKYHKKAVPVTFDAILDSLQKKKQMKKGYIVDDIKIQERNHRQRVEREAKKERSSEAPRHKGSGNTGQNNRSRATLYSNPY